MKKEDIRRLYYERLVEDNKTQKFLDCTSLHWFKKMKALEQDIKDKFSLSEKMSRIDIVEEVARDEDCQKKFSLSKDFMLLLTKVQVSEFETFLDIIKTLGLHNQQNSSWYKEFDNSQFEKVENYNIMFIRLLDFLLQEKDLKRLVLVLDRMEVEFIELWCEINLNRIKNSLSEDTNSKDLIYLFLKLFVLDENYIYLFEEDYLNAMERISSVTFKKVFDELEEDFTEKVINENFFKKTFKKLKLKEQIEVLEEFENLGYKSETIKLFHTFLNKTDDYDNIDDAIKNVFEMSRTRLNSILEGIEDSSLFRKRKLKSSEIWQFIINFNVDSTIDVSRNYFEEVVELYKKCMDYAKNSIVDSLYPLNKLTKKVTHINQDEIFNILIRVMTDYDYETVEESFTKRTFCGFTVITEKNLSHYEGGVKYGYFTGVTPELIAHIYPIDSYTNSSETCESKLTNLPNMLFDIDDLTFLALKFSTYCQVTMRTKLANGNILWPDCIVCYDKIDNESQEVADDLDLKILVIHKRSNAIEYNRDIYTYNYDPLKRVRYYNNPYDYKDYFAGK